MPPLLPIGNRRTRGVTLAAAPDDSSSQSDEESAPAGGKTARAARPLGGPTPRVAAAGPPAARAAPLSQPSPAVVTGPPRVVRVVKFAPTPTNQVVEVTPYSQVYGMNPAKFDFDPNVRDARVQPRRGYGQPGHPDGGLAAARVVGVVSSERRDPCGRGRRPRLRAVVADAVRGRGAGGACSVRDSAAQDGGSCGRPAIGTPIHLVLPAFGVAAGALR
ncbi:unnamed protein product [Prorocentrum cordatum]|uniref:Uncharacterized protein n=1 Tax=Prorocentrum cordatum TaxID=2364126 RepID=A0ABN9Y2X0_9DINO|nr:unnamed protein product [Polarella glacialis]